MAKPKDPAKEAALLDAAQRLVMEKGLTGLKMTDLAREAGVALGTTYLYFTDKRALLAAIYDRIRQRAALGSAEAFDPATPYERKVHRLWHGYFQQAIRHTEDMVFLEQYRRSPYLDKAVVAKADRALDPVRILLKEGIRDGHVKKMHVELMIQQISAGINRYAVMHRSGLLRMDKRRAKEAYRMAWDSIRA